MFKRVIFLLWGLLLFGFGIVLTIKSNLGTAPWDVLHLGIINYVALTMGQVSQLTGIVVIMASWLLGVRPGWGTLANMYFIGLFIDIFMSCSWMPTPNGLLLQFAMLLGGVLVIGWASFFYLSAAWGAGPRDSFMVGAMEKTKWPVWKIRTMIETSVAMVGYLLGGPVGIGTLLIAFTLGPAIQWAFTIMGTRAQDIKHVSLNGRMMRNDSTRNF